MRTWLQERFTPVVLGGDAQPGVTGSAIPDGALVSYANNSRASFQMAMMPVSVILDDGTGYQNFKGEPRLKVYGDNHPWEVLGWLTPDVQPRLYLPKGILHLQLARCDVDALGADAIQAFLESSTRLGRLVTIAVLYEWYALNLESRAVRLDWNGDVDYYSFSFRGRDCIRRRDCAEFAKLLVDRKPADGSDATPSDATP